MTDSQQLKPFRSILPAPEEIAKIAAALHRNASSSEEAVDEALGLYLRAYIRCHELAPLGLEKIILRLNDSELTQWLINDLTRPEKRRLYRDNAKLDAPTRIEFFQGDLDPVRQYLTGKAAYIGWKTSRQVRDSIKLFFLDEANHHNHRFKRGIEALDRHHQQMAAEHSTAERVVTVDELRNGMFIPWDQQRRDGVEEFRDFMARTAVREEGILDNYESGKKRSYHLGKVRFWEIEEPFLDMLIAWRREIKKRPGGIKQLEKGVRGCAFDKTGRRRLAQGYWSNRTFGIAAEFLTQNWVWLAETPGLMSQRTWKWEREAETRRGADFGPRADRRLAHAKEPTDQRSVGATSFAASSSSAMGLL